MKGDYISKNKTGEIEAISERQWRQCVLDYEDIVSIIADIEGGAASMDYQTYLLMPMKFTQARNIYRRFMRDLKDDRS